MRNKLRVASLLCFFAALSPAQQPPKEWQGVLKTLGRKGAYKSSVLSVPIRRDHQDVTIDGVKAPANFGLSGELRFVKAGTASLMTGELVLIENEVNPVLSALLEQGNEVTALHNEFLFDEPRVFCMHLTRRGPAMEVARGLKPGLDLIGHVPSHEQANQGFYPDPKGRLRVTEGSLDATSLARIVRHPAEQDGSVFTFTIPRGHLRTSDGVAATHAAEASASAAFMGSAEDAEIAGGLPVLTSELRGVLKTLRDNGLNITGIAPAGANSYRVQYWGRGPAPKLAIGFRSALDRLAGKHE